jgi:hypothetical protein
VTKNIKKDTKEVYAEKMEELKIKNLEKAYDNAVKNKHLLPQEAKKLKEEMLVDFKKKEEKNGSKK